MKATMRDRKASLTLSVSLAAVAVACALVALGDSRPALSWVLALAWISVATFAAVSIRKAGRNG